MNYLLRNKPKSGRQKFLRTALLLFVFLIVLSAFAPDLISRNLRIMVSPFWALKENIVNNNSLGASYKSKAALLAQNEDLLEKLRETNASLASYNQLEAENQEMRKALGALGGRKAVWAEVIVRPPLSLYDTFVVKIYSNDVRPLQKVLAYGATLIGEISEVDGSTALVRLYSAPGNHFEAVLESSGQQIEVTGTGSGNFIFEVPKAIEVKMDEKVFFNGTKNVIGSVRAIEEESSDSFKTVHLKSPINIYQLMAVQILI
jgi:cell shape-determining protein MreC